MHSKLHNKRSCGPIGVFDSGYGGLTIFKEINHLLPQYDYLYLGDNARTPYGTRSFEVVYEFTRQAVRYLFSSGCQLVILACNTASAKALRSIQQIDLPRIDPSRRVLGIIRPTVEHIGDITNSRHIGLLATEGTIKSLSYPLEIRKLFPDITLTGESCPIWVPLIECNEYNSPGADYFIQKHIDNLLSKDSLIDTIILGCTHYPLLVDKITSFVPQGIKIVTQGEAVAQGLKNYLERHRCLESRCTKGGVTHFCTTESEGTFSERASLFLEHTIKASSINL